MTATQFIRSMVGIDSETGTVAHAFQSQDALRAVVAAYDKALQDDESKLPTYLHMALEMARRSC